MHVLTVFIYSFRDISIISPLRALNISTWMFPYSFILMYFKVD